MKNLWVNLILAFVLSTGALQAAPEVAAVFNAASWMPAGLPGHGIAQGSMFVVTGVNMGPAELVFPSVLPLPTEMEGTSISVTVAGVTENAFMVYTWTNQLAAVLPSTIPTGQGTLTVTYNNETSAPIDILVVASAFGIFTRNQSGYGPAIVQNWISPADIRLNSLIEPAQEQQYEILWGTGLGAIAGDDSAAPPIGNLDVDVQVLVGGKAAVVQYKGRSAEFPGIDQIQFLIPAGVQGCYVSVVVIVNGVVSNFGTMSVNAAGGTCTDGVSFVPADLASTTQGRAARLGGIAIVGVNIGTPENPDGGRLTAASATFAAYSPVSMLQSLGPIGFFTNLLPISVGSCYVYQGLGDGLEFDDRALRDELDAGAAVHLTAPAPLGMLEMERDGPSYIVESDDEAFGIVPGLYTFDNGSGTEGIGPFQANITVADSQFTWTNQNAITRLLRSQELTVTWVGGDDASEVALIVGHGSRTELGVSGAFMCAERISAGQFTVPVWLLSTLPVSTPWDGSGDPTSGLIVGRISRLDQNRFAAEGLDAGFQFYLLADYLVVPVE